MIMRTLLSPDDTGKYIREELKGCTRLDLQSLDFIFEANYKILILLMTPPVLVSLGH